MSNGNNQPIIGSAVFWAVVSAISFFGAGAEMAKPGYGWAVVMLGEGAFGIFGVFVCLLPTWLRSPINAPTPSGHHTHE